MDLRFLFLVLVTGSVYSSTKLKLDDSEIPSLTMGEAISRLTILKRAISENDKKAILRDAANKGRGLVYSGPVKVITDPKNHAKFYMDKGSAFDSTDQEPPNQQGPPQEYSPNQQEAEQEGSPNQQEYQQEYSPNQQQQRPPNQQRPSYQQGSQQRPPYQQGSQQRPPYQQGSQQQGPQRPKKPIQQQSRAWDVPRPPAPPVIKHIEYDEP